MQTKGSYMKKLKIFLIVSVVILLGAGSYLLYMFKFKEYDVADESVAEIVSEPYKVDLPDGGTILIGENGDIVEGNGVAEENTNTNSVSPSTQKETLAGKTAGPTPNSPSSNTSTTKPTVATLKEKYRPAFEGLQAQADAKINALVGRAVSEYNDKKSSGEGVDFAYFYSKYTTAANDLEASTDTIFQAVMQAVEKDLVANGFDKSYAQSFKDEYEATKKARRDSLLSKALENR